MNEDGGADSFFARNSALLFKRGVTVGCCTLATEIDSLLSCPGTPSKIFELSPCAVRGLACFVGVLTGPPILKDAALVIRGVTVGGAVDAT